MGKIGAGIVAGLVATIVLSILMLIKGAAGLMPNLNVIQMLSGMMNAPMLAGWVAHFVIGALLWGIGFAVLQKTLPGNYALKGVLFALGAWLVMMIVVMPMAGAGLFAANMGPMAAVMTGVLHVIFGFVLGWTYGKFYSPVAA